MKIFNNIHKTAERNFEIEGDKIMYDNIKNGTGEENMNKKTMNTMNRYGIKFEEEFIPKGILGAFKRMKNKLKNHMVWSSRSYTDIPSPKCEEAVMSRRAYASIIAEAYANGYNESGGVLLGHKDNGKWYIVEATDPGFDAYHTPTRHEMNNKYVNYIYRILSRLYKEELYLVGLWHRHP